MPKEVLTPPRDYDPCQDRDAQRHHGPPQDKNTSGLWPTGDPCCNRDTKEKSVRKTCRSKMQLRKTSKSNRENEEAKSDRKKPSRVGPQPPALPTALWRELRGTGCNWDINEAEAKKED